MRHADLLWGVAAGLAAVALEAAMKKPSVRWLESLWWLAPCAVLLNFLVYKLVRASPSLPAAFVIFGAVTLSARTAFSIYAGHRVGTGTWVAIGLVLLALIARMWKP